jgi:hypothetical protein
VGVVVFIMDNIVVFVSIWAVDRWKNY